MYKIGDLIIYGNYGVCKVDSVGEPDIPGLDKDRTYYTLSPFYQAGKIFTPIDSRIFMRPVITNEEAQQLISIIPSISEYDYINNSKLLEDSYKECIKTHNCEDLIKVIKTVYMRKTILNDQGKKLGQIDESFMKKAEDLLYGELAVALGLPKDNVRSYIEERVTEQVETFQ